MIGRVVVAVMFLNLASQAKIAWIQNPITLKAAKQYETYESNLQMYISSEEKEKLSFVIDAPENILGSDFAYTDLPAWLRLSKEGRLTGTPGKGALSHNQFYVLVKDGNSSGYTRIILDVIPSSEVLLPTPSETLTQNVLNSWDRLEKLVNRADVTPLTLNKKTLSCCGLNSLEQEGVVGSCIFSASGKSEAVDFVFGLLVSDSSNSEDQKNWKIEVISEHFD